MQSIFVSKLSFITLSFECKDCKVFIGTSCMSAISKFDFQKRKQLRFSEVNYLNYTKTTQAVDPFHTR